PPRLCRSPAAPAAETDRSPEPGRRRAGRTSAHPDPTTRPDPRHRGPPHRYPTGPDAPGPGPGSPRGRVADPRPVSDGRAIRGRYPTEAVTARRTRRPSGTPYPGDRKSTRLNSSHVKISYAVFCLKKKKKQTKQQCTAQGQI